LYICTNIQLSTDVNFIASQALARSQQIPAEQLAAGMDGDAHPVADAMAALERQTRAAPIQGFVAASTGPQGGNIPVAEAPPAAANPDAIDIDEDDV